MLTAGTIVRRKNSSYHFPGTLAEILEVRERNAFGGGSLYRVRMLEGRIENWNSMYFDVEQPKEPDWEV
jgi:hypothetical protein